MKRIVVEGITAGALGATAVAAWFLLYDAAKGRLYFTDLTGGPVGLATTTVLATNGPMHQPVLDQVRFGR